MQCRIGFVNMFKIDFKGTLRSMINRIILILYAGTIFFVMKMIYPKVQIACKYGVLIHRFT